MKNSIGALILILSLLFAGCETTSRRLQSGESLNTEQGAILVSVTTAKRGDVNDAWFYFQKNGDEKRKRLDAFGGAGLAKPDDFKEDMSRYGRLLVIPAEPGEYQLTSWTLYVSRFGGYGYIYPALELPPLDFSVKKGEVTYIGNLHLEPELGKNMFGVKMTFGAAPRIHDRSDSDISLFKTKHPNLSDISISKQVLDVTPWDLPIQETDPNKSAHTTEASADTSTQRSKAPSETTSS